MRCAAPRPPAIELPACSLQLAGALAHARAPPPRLRNRRQQVWRIGEGLPFLEATARLRDRCLQELASGGFWAAAGAAPGGSRGGSRGGSSSSRGGGEAMCHPEEFPQLLACIAAAPSGAKLLAVLCRALGAEWRCTSFAGGWRARQARAWGLGRPGWAARVSLPPLCLPGARRALPPRGPAGSHAGPCTP
jgi:hypothetical protein